MKDEFTCATDDQCVRGAEQGICERTHLCGFADATCPISGRRYPERSGEASGACVVTGATYYAAIEGDDSNPGTEASPFRTVAHGASVLHAGDALLLKAGTYEEALTSEIPAGESWSYPVTIAPYHGDVATLTSPSADARPLTIEDPKQRYIVVRGLRVDAGPSSYEAVKILADHIRIQDCEIVGSQIEGVAVGGEDGVAGHVELVGLHIHDNGKGWANNPENGVPGGIAIGSAENLVERCWIHDNDGTGIQLYTTDNATTTNGNVIRGNRVHDVGPKDGTGIFVSSGKGTIVYDNLIYRTSDQGIRLDYGAVDTRIFNNTVDTQGTYGIEIGASVGAVVENNLFFIPGDPSRAYLDSGQATTDLANSADDPLFVDADHDDYHLRSGSPAIDKGLLLTDVPVDYDGVARPRGAAYDLGAFEFH